MLRPARRAVPLERAVLFGAFLASIVFFWISSRWHGTTPEPLQSRSSGGRYARSDLDVPIRADSADKRSTLLDEDEDPNHHRLLHEKRRDVDRTTLGRETEAQAQHEPDSDDDGRPRMTSWMPQGDREHAQTTNSFVASTDESSEKPTPRHDGIDEVESRAIIDRDDGAAGAQSQQTTTSPQHAVHFNKPTRLFHVTSGGHIVEGGVIILLPNVTGRNPSIPQHELDRAVWHKSGCGRSHWYGRGKCYWCSSRDPNNCTRKGSLRITFFKDAQKTGTLENHGVLDLIAMRPHTPAGTEGRVVFDPLYIACENLKPALPFDEPGVLLTDFLPDFVLHVNPRISQTPVKPVQRPDVVCTKSFYGTGINPRTVALFAIHYLENWKFDKIIMYEAGTSVGRLLMDVIEEDSRLRSYYEDGRIELIDLRDELQRVYGPIAKDVILFTSMNAQTIIMADCFTRAKLMNAEWILPIDWDEILTLGPSHDITKVRAGERITFREWAAGKSREFQQERNRSLNVILLGRIQPDELSFCDRCEESVWSEVDAMQYNLDHEQEILNATASHHKRHALVVNGLPKRPKGPVAPFALDLAIKYAVRVQNYRNPLSAGYGVHSISKCAFDLYNKLVEAYMSPQVRDVYLRHYRCANKRSSCDTKRIPVLNWAIEFGHVVRETASAPINALEPPKDPPEQPVPAEEAAEGDGDDAIPDA